MTKISSNSLRIKVSSRESSSFVILRRKGLSITTIAQAFGRSLSVVHKRISRNKQFEGPKFRFLDKRKYPPRIRILRALAEWKTMLRMLPAWEAFILGEGERPP